MQFTDTQLRTARRAVFPVKKVSAVARELPAPAALPAKGWVTAKEFAAIAGVHECTIYARMTLFRARPSAPDALPHQTQFGLPYRIPVDAAREWLTRLARVEGGAS
jgi:hypothetical protein